MEGFFILLAFFFGMLVALAPKSTVIVKGEGDGPRVVEYDGTLYRLTKLDDDR